jgi:hypothetical protein
MHAVGRSKRSAGVLAVCAFAALCLALPAAGEAQSPVIKRSGLSQVKPSTRSAIPAQAVTAKRKKKKKVVPAVTTTATAPISSSSTASATANCGGKTHITGGGYVVSPHYDPGGNTGLRSVNSASISVGATAWNARSDVFVAPPSSGSITTMARCESNSLGKLAVIVTGTATVPSGILDNLVIHCPAGTHVVGAGYDTTGLATYVNAFSSFRIFILQSRRTGLSEWTISAFESSASPDSGNVSVAAICEVNAKGRSISEVAQIAPFGNVSRASADATCPAKQHVISGGYVLSPIPANSGAPPIVGVDEFNPVGNSTWHLGLHTVGPQPAGSSVATYAYCAPDSIKKKKRKKH